MDIKLVTGRPNEVGQVDVFVMYRKEGALHLTVRDPSGETTRMSAAFGSRMVIDGTPWSLVEVPVDPNRQRDEEDGTPVAVAILTSLDG